MGEVHQRLGLTVGHDVSLHQKCQFSTSESRAILLILESDYENILGSWLQAEVDILLILESDYENILGS